MNFSNKKILKTFTSPHSKNVWAEIETVGWRKVGQESADGVTNMAIVINAARANNITVSGFIDDGTNLINHLYL